jgi:outer membrane biosynthesis protein TonB
MKDLKDESWFWVVVGAGAVLLLAILYFVFFGVANASRVEKVLWCHTEPNGNSQTLELPLAALQNAGHVDASGNPLHAGDYAGACIEPSVTPSITISPTPSIEPSVMPSVTVEPTKEPKTEPSITPTIIPSPTSVPQNNTEEKKEESKTSTVNTTSEKLIPCSVPNTCGMK